MRERRFSTGDRGLELCLCEWGEASDAPPVVICHGFLEQGAAWEHVASRLDRHVIAPDHRGHGKSDWVGAGGYYHFWDYVSDLDALVQALGGRVHLVGHSMGGTIAALYAGCRPRTVEKLVLVEGLGPPDATDQALDRARAFLDAMRAPPTHKPIPSPEAAAARLKRFNPQLGAEALALGGRLLDAHAGTWRWDPLHRSRAPFPFQSAIFEQFLAQIQAPTLVIEGANSRWKPAGWEQRLATIPHARPHTIKEAGHLIHHDQPAELAHVIAAHLDRRLGGASL